MLEDVQACVVCVSGLCARARAVCCSCVHAHSSQAPRKAVPPAPTTRLRPSLVMTAMVAACVWCAGDVSMHLHTRLHSRPHACRGHAALQVAPCMRACARLLYSYGTLSCMHACTPGPNSRPAARMHACTHAHTHACSRASSPPQSLTVHKRRQRRISCLVRHLGATASALPVGPPRSSALHHLEGSGVGAASSKQKTSNMLRQSLSRQWQLAGRAPVGQAGLGRAPAPRMHRRHACKASAGAVGVLLRACMRAHACAHPRARLLGQTLPPPKHTPSWLRRQRSR